MVVALRPAVFAKRLRLRRLDAFFSTRPIAPRVSVGRRIVHATNSHKTALSVDVVLRSRPIIDKLREDEMNQSVIEMTKSDLSFSQDYSLLVPRDLDLSTLHPVRPDMMFVFDSASSDGETSYGTFNFRISPSSAPKSPMMPVELRLWGFHIEGRKVVCAVTRSGDPAYDHKGKGWSEDETHYLYSIEAVNVACFSHKADLFMNTSDVEMFKKIIRELQPAYDRNFRHTILRRTSPKSTSKIVDNTLTPNPQILSFLGRTTNVTDDLQVAEERVSGIDTFFGPDWRLKADNSLDNTQGIDVSGDRSELLWGFRVTLNSCSYWFTYDYTVDSANGYGIPVGILYTPKFENGIDVSWLGKPEELCRNFETAETIATWCVYKRLHKVVRGKHPDAVINVVSMKGAL